ncbi:MAG: hypothetical protein K1X79_05795 [Oligoflexia bacterium]|nr:hypothetical protein [Oligoflexia bacterium]
MMNRRKFIKTMSLGGCAALTGCAYLKVDLWSPFLRSDIITNPEQEQAVLRRARLTWTDDNMVRVLHLSGNAYERGYQHGALLRDEVQRNLTYLYESATRKFHMRELFAEAFERARPFIPEPYMDEMHGLAHGSKLPLELIQHIHILPEIGEWGGKRQIKTVVKQMMNDELGTSCSNFCSFGSSSKGDFYTVRILDWGLHRISKLHQYPLIQVHHPERGFSFANIGWVGFIGAISGMNARGITLGEMGYGNPEGETLHGKPMPFLLRDILQNAESLSDARHIISESAGTCSYVFLISDGKKKEAELYVRDKSRFRIFKPGDRIVDRDNDIKPVDDVLYAGHWNDRMQSVLTKYHGEITPQIIMREVVPYVAMPSNFQNVIYDPVNLRFWVANAANTEERAADQNYTFFDLRAALASNS